MTNSILRAMVLVLFCLACHDGAETMDTEKKLEDLRKQMVDKQIRARGVKDPAVLEALLRVERHHFVPHGLETAAYDDTPLSIGEGQTISQPYIVALMRSI